MCLFPLTLIIRVVSFGCCDADRGLKKTVLKFKPTKLLKRWSPTSCCGGQSHMLAIRLTV